MRDDLGSASAAYFFLDRDHFAAHPFFFQAEDAIRDLIVTGVQTCALPISQHYTPVNDRPPYDVAGWTLPFTMGVRADVVDAPFTANLVKVDSVVPVPGRIEGTGEMFVLRNRSN